MIQRGIITLRSNRRKCIRKPGDKIIIVKNKGTVAPLVFKPLGSPIWDLRRRVLFGPDNPYFRVNAVVVREVSLPSSIIALVITTRLFAAFTRTAITPNATLLMPWLTL